MLAKVLVGCVAMLGCACVPVAADAAAVPLSTSSPSGTVVIGSITAADGLPPFGVPGAAARSIRTITATFDEATGVWTTQIVFYGAESVATQAKLYLSLGESSFAPRAPLVGVTAWTDPAAPRPTQLDSTGTPTSVVAFSADLRTMTITVTDPALVGLPMNELNQPRLSRSDVLFDLFPAVTLHAPSGEGAGPTVGLPASDRSLRVNAGAISLRLGEITHPSSVAAFVKLGGRVVARGEVNPGSGVPPSMPLTVGRGVRLPRSGRHAAKLIVVVYSPTGVSTTVTRAVSLTT